MKAVILAAGASTRLRPLTNETPKSLLTVGGTPILKRALDTLVDLGIDQFALVTGFQEQKIRDACRAWHPRARFEFFTNEAYSTTQNAPSLLLARPAVDGQEFVMLDADIVFERGVLQVVLESEHPDCLALRPSDDLSDEEIKAELDADGYVRLLDKTVDIAKAAGESIGIERFSAKTSRILFEVLSDRVERRGLTMEWYEKSFEEMIATRGVKLKPISVGNMYCAEIDTKEDLEAADRSMRRMVTIVP